MIGGEDDEGVLGEAGVLERVQHQMRGVVEGADGALEAGEIFARF